MKRNFSMLQQAMKRGISQNPFMLHGTSLETLQIAIKTGRLPASIQPGIKGQIYFTPITNNFRKSKHYIALRGEYTFEDAMRFSRGYAEGNARTHYLEKRLGYFPSWFWGAVETHHNLIEFLVHDEKMRRKRARDIVDKLMKRKGFILEPEESIFEFKYQRGDDPTTVAVVCPEGLPLECVKGIRPLGRMERRFFL